MNSVLKKVLPVVLLIWPYLFFAGFLIGEENENLFSAFFLGYLVMTAVVYFMNIVNAWMYKGEDNCYRLAFFDMLIKLLHIPFYLLVFLIGVLMFMAMVVPALVFVSPFILFMLFVVDLFLMITSSMYGVSALVKAARQGKVSKKYAVVHGILHFLFVTDVISAVCVFVKMSVVRRKEKSNLT